MSKLPEINVNEGVLVEEIMELGQIRSEIAHLQTQEKEIKQKITTIACDMRIKEAEKKIYIGLLRITPPEEATPCRVEFRMKNGAIDPSEETRLENLFGGAKTALYEKVKAVVEVLDPKQLIEDLQAAGLNPYDYLDISVRKDSNRHVAGINTTSVRTQEALVPVTGFLKTLNEVAKSIPDQSHKSIGAYLEKALEPCVVVGTRGKGGK